MDRFFAVTGKHSNAPPPEVSPLAWGDPAHVERLLGRYFALSFEPGINNAYYDDVSDIWNRYVHGFGPVRALYEQLDQRRREARLSR